MMFNQLDNFNLPSFLAQLPNYERVRRPRRRGDLGTAA
jgi:hypothetical protein